MSYRKVLKNIENMLTNTSSLYIIILQGEIAMIINKAYKFRLYPNDKQKELINKTLGCTRFIYNYMLSQKKDNVFLSNFDLINYFTRKFLD